MTKEEIKQLFKTGNKVLIADALKEFFFEQNYKRRPYQITSYQPDIIETAEEIFRR